ncbi:MAG: tetratricopeptide (TPR) repeat protein [Methylophagaceae bacterium]|jgi:tetratricopeptide (TPR) repeat protein
MMQTVYKLFLLLLLMNLGSVSLAKEKQYLLTEKTYKAVSAAQELMTAEQYLEAQSQLLVILSKTKAGSYDRAVVQQTLGYVYSAKSQYKNAREHFQQALDSEVLQETVSHGLRYNLGQLLLAEDKFDAGIQVLELWFEAEPKPPNNAHVLIASAYYQTGQFRQSVNHMTQAVTNREKPPENWYQLLLAGHLELKEYSDGISVLEKLIVRFQNNDNYWAHLSALYAQQNKQTSALAVDVLASYLELGDGRVVERLSDMYRYLHIPYKSAMLLQKGLKQGRVTKNTKNLNRLADSWLAARERGKAVLVLEQLALSDQSGKASLKLGRVLFDLEQWGEASNAFKVSLKYLKGGKRGSAALMAGLSQFYLGDFGQAQSWLSQAARYKNEGRQARYWLDYIDQVVDAEAEQEEEMLS